MTGGQRDLLSRLADAGEEAIQRLADAPGGERVVGAVNALRDRMDEMQRRIRGLDELERRVTALERRVDQLDGGGATSVVDVAETTGTTTGAAGLTATGTTVGTPTYASTADVDEPAEATPTTASPFDPPGAAEAPDPPAPGEPV